MAVEDRQFSIANNIANAATTGYKRQSPVQLGFYEVFSAKMKRPFHFDAEAAPAGTQVGTHLEGIPKEPLSDAEKKGLLLMREEEKLARDLYKALYDKWGIRAFSNIAKSEQQHMDSVKALLDRYGLADPVGSNKPGEFSDPALQKAYDDLLKKGLLSRAEAVTVGAMVEELDIKDLREERRKADNRSEERRLGKSCNSRVCLIH